MNEKPAANEPVHTAHPNMSVTHLSKFTTSPYLPLKRYDP